MRTISTSSLTLEYKICDGDEKYQIIAFGIGVGGLSSELSPTFEPNPQDFNFLKTTNHPFSINNEAITLFRSLRQDENLFQLLKNPTKPLIITGHSIGGWVASLICLWLLDNIKQSNLNLPICITFGSPLLGDDGFYRAIHSPSVWNSRFLHVVSYGDLIPRTFLSSTEYSYKPFGTFLICSSSSSACACFNDPVSVLSVLAATDGSPQMPNIDYGKLLEDLTNQMIVSKGASQLWELRGNPLRTGITLQLDAIGVERNQDNNEEDTLVKKIEEWERKNFRAKVKRISEAEKKLNDMKKNMAHIEWYKKISSTDMGYYDCFKGKANPRDIHVVKYKIGLTKYWEEVVTEAETKPQKQGAPLPMRQLNAGTNYRRMVEPLDIAEHYKKNNTDYRTTGRARHYELLERWLEEQEKTGGHQRKAGTKAASLTLDSCFWDAVEKAVIWTKSLKNGQAAGEPEEEPLVEKLKKFEEYVMGLIDELAVSPEVFLKESTFMQWWKVYETIPERNGSSRLANFMENKGYQKYN
ncbi:senescence-associated carboxylesterase 101-like isoform X2 [Macadamia integrifolia]|nr:senescence-associated carboxylesterase 101-like isoform X2 [Macadamia integrifolia]XP_042484444.1 senescence-associated carboxylesterase 101-like isoform X2 [Macadamia integrifolia]